MLYEDLPLEVRQRILGPLLHASNLDVCRGKSFLLRYSVPMQTLSLVCRSWGLIARRELSHVNIWFCIQYHGSPKLAPLNFVPAIMPSAFLDPIGCCQPAATISLTALALVRDHSSTGTYIISASSFACYLDWLRCYQARTQPPALLVFDPNAKINRPKKRRCYSFVLRFHQYYRESPDGKICHSRKPTLLIGWEKATYEVLRHDEAAHLHGMFRQPFDTKRWIIHVLRAMRHWKRMANALHSNGKDSLALQNGFPVQHVNTIKDIHRIIDQTPRDAATTTGVS
ncbi:hypothetical protein K431DRAFT_299080 [Polychaeton citri CBS 116435]|uniref:Uncharacterized protein n=1 Tax=Polychaeton citri CBS 116435 TaxID=1314669 RepID=A0A9P4UJ30_9PEZI|nr:hypothetical protein K431DRAFT_299080 [Polychaeton citri CBS 116435]